MKIRALPAALLLAVALTACAMTPATPTSTAPAASNQQASNIGTPTGTESATTTPTGTPSTSPSASGLVKWPDNSKVSHVFYHSLIVDPKRAFAKSNSMRVGYMQYMVTIDEFTKQLEAMYAKGYMLIHPQRIAAPDANGVMRYTPLYLPKGKKPLVLSIDDVSYYKYMDGAGFASKLILTPEGKVTNTYTDAAGKTHQGAYDVSTVVDRFVAAHPDFSLEGDKGTIALTGYEGVLGYRSSLSVFGDNAKTRQEMADAKAVADAMKADGWKFASHSFGHIDMTKRSLAKIKSDTHRWLADVEPIIGKTPLLIFAFGADIADYHPYSTKNKKYAYLLSKGFTYFFPIDSGTPHWEQLTRTSLRQARINIDGISMQRALDGRRSALHYFFDTKKMLDDQRPMPTPGV